MTTGYEKILALIHKKNQEEVSGYQPNITNDNYLEKGETCQVSQRYQRSIGEVSGAQTPSTSLVQGGGEWLKNVVELAVTGQLTESVHVSVKPSYQHILGEGVWFCPDPEAAGNKAPDLAFTSAELPIIIPLLIENRELALPIINAKRIFGGTIMEGDSELEADDPEDGPPDSPLCPEPKSDETPEHRTQPPSPGRHLVIIRSVRAYLYNFREYTGPRVWMEMEILEGTDSGKIIVDNISLPHEKESKGMGLRRVRIAVRLGLIPRGTEGTIRVNWKLLEGVVCWARVVHRTFKGHLFPIVTDYELSGRND
jgi:hypothetical protein